MQKDWTTDEVLAKFSAGPTTGIFTDGGSRPNPGPGGWGMVHVVDNQIVSEHTGDDQQTTNNRMEYAAIIYALKSLRPDDTITIYSDSNLIVQTLNTWVHNWRRNNWRKKGGEIKNLELVQEADSLYRNLPNVKLEWIKAHNGWRWNEYADALASRCFN